MRAPANVFGIEVVIKRVKRAYLIDLAQYALVEQLPGFAHRWHKYLIVRAHQHYAAVADCFLHSSGLFEGQTQWLFAQDGFADGGGRDDGIFVQVMRQADIYRIYIACSEHTLHIVKYLRSSGLLCSSPCVL